MRTSIFALFLLGTATQHAVAQPAPAAPAPTADDLARAADAAADVAAMAPADAAPAPAPEGAVKASADDIDLSSLGLDSAASSFDDKLNIYGFADVSWSALHLARKSLILAKDSRSFAVGNLNIYLAKNLTPKARVLGEVRFTFLPNANQLADGSYVSTLATDVNNANRPVQWGGVVIERLYVEYDLTEHLTLRAGHWLTPYGIWNIDHGSPAIVAVSRPYIIGEQFFPEHQTGLDLFGNYYKSGYKLNYHLTASNGRGPAEAQVDQDTDVAVGARLDVETPFGIKAGASYYYGRNTGFAPSPGAAEPTYLEAAYAGDLQYDRGGLHLQAEVAARERQYEDGTRAPAVAGFAPDGRDFGYYVLGSYRFDRFWSVTPFAYFEHYSPQDHFLFKKADAINAGLNFRPSPGFVLKLQGLRATFPEGPGLLDGNKIYQYQAQASWVF